MSDAFRGGLEVIYGNRVRGLWRERSALRELVRRYRT
jgi:hypothetical protein